VSSASVSKNVAGLERALGVRLTNRTTRTLKLTSEGVVFLEQARIALDALDLAVDMVAAQRVEPTGRVRISTSAAFGRDQLMPVLPGLLERYPELSVEVDFDDRRIDLTNEGYDLACGGQIFDSALVSRPICRLNMALFASPAYLARHGVPRTPQGLKQHHIVINPETMKWCFNTRIEHCWRRAYTL
jgi:DNA-binding transcriptional LysR family regulator